MRKRMLYLVAVILLAGCGANDTADAEGGEKVQETEGVESGGTPAADTEKEESNDSELTEIRESYEDETYKVTLKAITDVNETTAVGPMEVTIEDVKVLTIEPSQEAHEEYYYQYSSEEEFDYPHIQATSENTSEDMVNFNPVSTVE
ncbi:hypothetical protein [Alteribacillus iranensis]|uniref:Uncharacterized protein n=1 Tax=Alteribacillus iranensis TaxID=930128 RepID=A0A1I2BSS0_9BACI|nr:hypothetical protein [Alteribacillus iranensis]SFE59211.1 hypothetical protein SAMN05192532_102490 [Alteribacillus iranensis]